MSSNKIEPRIIQLSEKKLVGQKVNMSLVNNKTHQLWSQFSPEIKEIQNRISEDKISMQVYPPLYYQNFNPSNEFEKWATVEVHNFNTVPQNMNTFVLKEGIYAVFDYKGLSSDTSIFQYILTNTN